MEDKILVQDRTVDKCIKIINKYEDKMREIHITDNIILNQTLADDILKIAHEKKYHQKSDVLNKEIISHITQIQKLFHSILRTHYFGKIYL